MANEITMGVSLRLVQSGLDLTREFSKLADKAGLYHNYTVFNVTQAAPVAAPIGSIGTVGVVLFRNMDAVNFVKYGRDISGTKHFFGQMLPGEPALYRVFGSAPYLQADIADCKVEMWLLEL